MNDSKYIFSDDTSFQKSADELSGNLEGSN